MPTSAVASSRLISLDIDGILHPTGDGREVAPTSHFVWLPHLTSLLAPHPDVAVLVHSTWRYTHTLDELRDLLGPLGSWVLDTTPRGPRYESILWWLHMNPSFTDYRILDDDASEFPVPPPGELILCNPAMGVTDAGVTASLKSWLHAGPAIDETEVPY